MPLSGIRKVSKLLSRQLSQPTLECTCGQFSDFDNKAQDVHDEAKSPGTWKKSWDKMDR